jgi:hypothetical protein
MSDRDTEIDAVQELETAWSQAEIRADTGALEAIAGSGLHARTLGFVLDEHLWLER